MREMVTEERREDLTDARYWDDAYTASGAAVAGWRRRIQERVQVGLDAMWCRMIDHAAGGRRLEILEIGCAPGWLLERIHQLRPLHRLHGVDFAAEGIEIARERLRRAGADVTLHQGDIRTYELPQRYDLVLSYGLIEHFVDPAPIIECHLRAAVGGGTVALTVPSYASPRLQRLLVETLSPETFLTHNAAIMAPTALRRAMENAGLQGVATGTAGGPLLRTEGTGSTVFGRGLRAFGRAWNVAAALVPAAHGLWGCHIWGTGTT